MNKYSKKRPVCLTAKEIHQLITDAQESIDIAERLQVKLKVFMRDSRDFPSSWAKLEKLKDPNILEKSTYFTQMIVLSMNPHLDETNNIIKELSGQIGCLRLLYSEIQPTEEEANDG